MFFKQIFDSVVCYRICIWFVRVNNVFFLQTSDVDIMEIAWGVDIDPVIAMISIAFG